MSKLSPQNSNTASTSEWLEPNRLIAAVATLIVALLLLLLLLLVHFHLPQRDSDLPPSELTMSAIEPDDAEQFIEPLLLDNAGEQDATDNTDPAPVPDGVPDLAPKPNNKKVVNGENPTQNPSQERLVSSRNKSSRKTAEPDKKNEPDSRIADNMKGQFSPHNGRSGGSSTPSAQSGSGGKGTGVSGSMKGGRKLLSCPVPSVTLRQRVVIKVEVYVNAEGRVTEANVISGSSDPSLREKCRQASLKARWTPKSDAPRTRGVITWTLVPKV